jgi:hypothetical protein
VDLGSPLAFPGCSQPQAQEAAAAIGETFHAVYIVVRAEADLLARTLRILGSLAVPRARLVVCRPPHRREMRRTLAILSDSLPEYGPVVEWDWDHQRVLIAAVADRPLFREGMAEELGLLGEGAVVPAHPSPSRLPRPSWLRRGA